MGTQINVGTAADDGTGNTLRVGGQLINTVLIKVDCSTTGIFAFASATSIVMGATLATSATTGFVYLPTTPSTVTGVPQTQTGTVPVCIDTNSNRLQAYIGGSWRTVQLT